MGSLAHLCSFLTVLLRLMDVTGTSAAVHVALLSDLSCLGMEEIDTRKGDCMRPMTTGAMSCYCNGWVDGKEASCGSGWVMDAAHDGNVGKEARPSINRSR